MIKYSTPASFATDVLLQEGKVLVYFWAEWCGPCKALAPTIEEISTHLDVAKVNTDDSSGLAAELSIRAVPTLILFENGKEIKRITGTRPKAVLMKELELNL
jgi:thioredoxin 1